jgi:hypothetical protein
MVVVSLARRKKDPPYPDYFPGVNLLTAAVMKAIGIKDKKKNRDIRDAIENLITVLQKRKYQIEEDSWPGR